MTNSEKYDGAFCRALGVAERDLLALKYGSVAAWDSAGHMILVAEIEDTFRISLTVAEIMKFNSYAEGRQILEKYGVKLD
ncbi:MAG: acyl carrier protein [Selenomonadaceae bacterium]|nr:acyl carrier protein [Selenomonadaceae bacterium]